MVVIIYFVFLGWTNRWKELGQPWSHRVSVGVLGGWAKSVLLGRGPTYFQAPLWFLGGLRQ